MTAPAPQRVLYVGSWSRSGSTLLDLMLGRIPAFVSAGEVRFLWDRGLIEGQLCGCGVPVPRCPFWGAVLNQAFGPGAGPDPADMVALRDRVDGLGRLPLTAAPWRPAGLGRDLRAFQAVLARLYRAIAAVAGAAVVVDSSKYAAYGRLVAGAPGLDLRLVHLVRDSRAVAYSWTRTKRLREVADEERYMPVLPAWRSAAFWNLENVALELVRPAATRSAVLRYDELTAQPAEALRLTLGRLDLSGDTGGLAAGRLSVQPNHTVAGNPLRLGRDEISIRADVEWKDRLSRGDRRTVTALTWPLLLRYGFPIRSGS
ncbi:MAG TPA: hypothetical protein VFJ92_17475 [Gemmatimonadales bacterium]|nr:hypothetical protein [Gemmatimonadales bacterium]